MMREGKARNSGTWSASSASATRAASTQSRAAAGSRGEMTKTEQRELREVLFSVCDTLVQSRVTLKEAFDGFDRNGEWKKGIAHPAFRIMQLSADRPLASRYHEKITSAAVSLRLCDVLGSLTRLHARAQHTRAPRR